MRAADSNSSVATRGRRLWLLALMVLTVLLSACQADMDVVVDVEEDGSGRVAVTLVLDREAASALLDLEGEDGLRLDDLFQAGWEIVPPEQTENGGVRTTAVKQFGTPEQFAQVMAELSGSAGLFDAFGLTRTKGFARVEFEMGGEIVPPGSFNQFSDPELDALLGRTLDALAADYGAVPDQVNVTVTVRMPGTVDADGSNGQSDLAVGDDAIRTWEANLGDDAPVPIALASSTREVSALVWRGVAIVAAVLAVLVGFGHLLRLLRPERRRGGGASRPKPRPRPKQVDEGSDEAPTADAAPDSVAAEPVPDNPNVVALDGMGVLYKEGDDINRILVPFVRERGSEVTHDEIVAKARLISLGRITPSEFWAAVGVPGDPNETDDDYLSRFQLNPGVVKFLRSLRDRGVRVACVTNDSTAWANKLRAKHSLEGLIDPWVVSGAVGVRKPDPPIFEALRRVTQEEPGQIMVVDDALENLDAAREFGFRTAWFAPDGTTDEARGHAILRSFEITEGEEPAGVGS